MGSQGAGIEKLAVAVHQARFLKPYNSITGRILTWDLNLET